MVKEVGIAELKASLSEILRDLERGGGRVVVCRRGRRVAVIQGYEPSVAEEPVHWAAALDGIARDIEDFDEITDDVVRSRRQAGTRSVDLDD